MKNRILRKMLCLVLTAAMMVSVMAGCGQKESGESTGKTSGSGETAKTQESSSGADETGKLTFPLEKKVTLTLWAGSLSQYLTNLVTDYNDTDFFQELERRTNVHIEFDTISSATTASEAFNLMISSGDLPDMIMGAGLYTAGMDAAVEDGYYLDLTPYLDTYLSNFNALRTADEDVLLDSITDAGRVVRVQNISQTQQPLFMGLMIRKDWLDKDGLDIPKTLEDWEAVLTAFKENHGAYAPFALTPYYDMFLYGFNATTGFMVRDGKVIYSPTSENMKEALTVYSDWYKKGLIDPDFMARETGYAGDTSMIVTGQSGVFNSYYTLMDYYYQSSTDPDMELVAVNPPVCASGEESRLAAPIPKLSGDGVAISTQCDNPDIAMMWLDYLFSEEGVLLANYGIEGDTFEYVDGKPQFTEKITNNPDGLSMNQAMSMYTCPPAVLAKSYSSERELAGVSEESLAMCDVWSLVPSDYFYPFTAIMTSDENNEFAAMYSDISTYVTSEIASFISGEKDISTEWDEYVSTIEGLGIERCVELKQNAYDRYLSRGTE